MPFRPIGPGMNQDDVARVANDNFIEVDNRLSPFIVKDENGDRRVILGKLTDGTYGMKVSQEGVDVTAASNSQLIFNSQQNLFKIVDTGTITVTKGASTTVGAETIPHGLGTTPLVVSFVSCDDFFGDNNPVPHYETSTFVDNSGCVVIQADVYTNSTSITFSVLTADFSDFPTGGSGSVVEYYTKEVVVDYKYYVLVESAV